MPGFGSGPFGHGAFGEWAWGKNVLFFLAPENPYRVHDTAGFFEAYAEAQAASFERLRRKIRNLGDLKDPLLVPAADDVSILLRLGPKLRVLSEVEQFGIHAAVSITGALETGNGRFTFADIGKEITIEKSIVLGNNRVVTISGIGSVSSVSTQPTLAVDVGPLRWTLRTVEADDPAGIKYEVAAGSVSDILLGWPLSDGFSEVTVAERTLFPAATVERNLYTDREGSNGYFDGLGHFHSDNGGFAQHEVGRLLSLALSVNPENTGRFEIVEVVSATEVVLDATDIVANDGGPLTWALLRRSQLVLEGVNVLRGVVEQYGSDLTISGSNLVTVSADFTAADVAKIVTIRATGSAANGNYVITAVPSRTQVTVIPTPPVDASVFYWEVRAATEIGDGTQVQVRALSLLQYLAQDFGVELDTREDEIFQRRWVASVPRWIPLKGSADGYAFMGKLTGFDVTATALFRVTLPIYDLLGNGIAVGETGAGRSGTNGTLTTVGLRVRFTAPTALFTYLDVGLQIEVQDSGSGNDGLRTIDSVVDAQTVEFSILDAATTPDANNGALVWRIVRLYARVPPELPVFDEINADLMTYLKGAPAFTIDKYCTETGWDTKVGTGYDGVLVITGVTPGTPSPVPVTYTVAVYGDIDVVTGLGIGRWKLTDSDSVAYFLEAPPTEVLEVGVGRSGTDGDLNAVDTFTSATAVFTVNDVGRQLRISGSGSGNDGRHRILAFIDPQNVQLSETPILPEANSGSLTWAVVSWTVPIIATIPPATGGAFIEYMCSRSALTCDYCPSNRVLITANSSLALTDPLTRLVDRLDQVRPAHVGLVFDAGMTATATVVFSATVTTP